MSNTLRSWIRRVSVLLAVGAAAACSGQKEAAPKPGAPAQSAAVAGEDDPLPATASPYDALPEGVQELLDTPFTGDFDALVKRHALAKRVEDDCPCGRPRPDKAN